MDKEDVVYVQQNFTQSLKETKGNLAICDMDESRGYYAKWNEWVRETNTYDLTDMWNINNKTKQNENRLTDTQNKWVVARKEGAGWGQGGEAGGAK